MAPGKRALLFFHTVRYSRVEQLLRRAGYLVRRRFRRGAARWGLAPGRWYRDPPPPEASGASWPPVRFAVPPGAGMVGGAPGPEGSAAKAPGHAGAAGVPGQAAGPAVGPAATPNLPTTVRLPGATWPLEGATRWRRPQVDELSALDRLTLHYMEFLPRIAPEDAAAVMQDWIQANPPYAEVDDWNGAWNSYAVSIRTVIWMDLLRGPLAAGAPAMVAGASAMADRTSAMAGQHATLRPRLLQSLAAQLRFLAANLERDIGGNHLLKNLRALLRGSAFFTGPEAEGWRESALRHLGRELEEQILPDGMHFERSPTYHLQVLGDLLDVKAVLDAGGEGNSALDDALSPMIRAAALLTHPDGRPSLFADGGLHTTHDPADLLKAAEELGVVGEESAGVVGAAGDAADEAAESWALPHAGYFGLRVHRRGEDDDLLMVDCGPVGPDHLPAHGHGDALSFEWTVGGRRVVVDAGVAEYQGPLRPYSRSTVAHNTVTVDDADQSEFWSAFRVGRRARARLEASGGASQGGLVQGDGPAGEPRFRLVGSHDGYRRLAGSPIHRRSVEAGPGWVRVADEVTGGRSQPVRARILLAAGVEARLAEGGREGEGAVLITVPPGHPPGHPTGYPAGVGGAGEAGAGVGAGSGQRAGDGGEAPLRIQLTSASPLRLERGIWMPDFGTKLEVWRVVMDYGEAPVTGGFELRVLAWEGKDG